MRVTACDNYSLSNHCCSFVFISRLSMEVKPSLSLPWKTRILLSTMTTLLNVSSRSNGTVNRRLFDFFTLRSSPVSSPVNGMKTYNVTVDPTRNLWFRVFVPTQHAAEDLPLIVFFHGGGFAYLSPDSKWYDDLCRRFAKGVPAVIVSVNYRLTPEHRYPAQHNDCFDVLKFLDDEENWSKSMPENTNPSRCFLAGDSAGGNLAHHVAHRACQFKFQQLKVMGVVAIQPFFGGEERTESERRLGGMPIISMKLTDWAWKALMPLWDQEFGRDHPIINISGPNTVDISKIDFPATIVFVGGFDGLCDWQKRYYEWLKKSGKETCLVEYPNMCHFFYAFPDLPESGQMISEMKDFIHKVSKNVD